MRYLLFIIFLLGVLSVEGQTKTTVDSIHHTITVAKRLRDGSVDVKLYDWEDYAIKQRLDFLTRRLMELDLRLDSLKNEARIHFFEWPDTPKTYTPPPYWTVWFTMTRPSKEFEAIHDANKCIACDSLKYHPNSKWVESFYDSAAAYQYYNRLKSTGRVLMWQKYECGVDTAKVYIDRYDMAKRKYDHDN